jgi:hypothetical protein
MHVSRTWARAKNYNCGQPGAAAWAWGSRDFSWDPTLQHCCKGFMIPVSRLTSSLVPLRV